MGAKIIQCGEYANQSEKTAVEHLRSKLQGHEGYWILLSNLYFSYSSNKLSKEIDLVVIGPNGIKVVEIKHWDLSFFNTPSPIVQKAAELINTKSKLIAGKLREHRIDVGYVSACLFLTKSESKTNAGTSQKTYGVPVYDLTNWYDLISLDGETSLSIEQIKHAAQILNPHPETKLALTGNLRSFAGLKNLERISSKEDEFHRVFKGKDSTSGDKVILHLYDLSASQEKNPLELARREFDTIRLWQKSEFVPSLLDSFQEVENFSGELSYFSLVDSDCPSLEKKKSDKSWNFNSRIEYSLAAIEALANFHNPPDGSNLPPFIHRRISPKVLKVQYNNLPLFTDFALTRLQNIQTITINETDFKGLEPYIAPEVLSGGFSAANYSSDIFALCSSLSILFTENEPLNEQVRAILKKGSVKDFKERISLEALKDLFKELIHQESKPIVKNESEPKYLLPEPEYWSEDTKVNFKNSCFKIISVLGKGGIGQTFKVVEIDAKSQDEKFGTYLAKTVREEKNGEMAIKAYKKVRQHTTGSNLSTIHEYATEWDRYSFVALMKWIDGNPLDDLSGALSIYAEDIKISSQEQLCLKWLTDICLALGELHRVGLVHGDVSPKNIIVQESNVILTDYDTVTENNCKCIFKTFAYSSPLIEQRGSINFSDDIYSLAASFFYVLTDREPFKYGEETRKDCGLNWDNFDELTFLKPFFDKATSLDESVRFVDAQEAAQYLYQSTTNGSESNHSQILPRLTPNQVPWLHSLLTSYPGSRFGNSETRGLDSDFAVSTYVETSLDEILYEEIENNKINLVILFGNAGDGKTAFLQNLGKRFGLEDMKSSKRIWETTLCDQRKMMVNLDGSAAWNGRSANELLDELFAPFHTPDYSRQVVHIVAINSGKLLEWIEQKEETYLTQQLLKVLMEESEGLDPRFRLIDLNQRSLVGGIDLSNSKITTDFLNKLLEKFLHNNQENPWSLCPTCSAQKRCTAWNSVEILKDTLKGKYVRDMLIKALQACHQRGEIHITARELRAALSYIFFGVYDCSDMHGDPTLITEGFWQRVFNVKSSHRQGELLKELSRFDPALDSDPRLDRELIKKRTKNTDLAELRRREYFLPENQNKNTKLTLTGCRYFESFRDFPLLSQQVQHELMRSLCIGIAKLEDLPSLAFSQEHLSKGLPIRLTPRTPTETFLWVIKPWSNFTLETTSLKGSGRGLEFLPTQLRLTYTYTDGNEEVLVLGLDLFNLLLELKDGFQLSGISQEGIFSNLEIFTQRLVSENTRNIYGWHPEKDKEIFNIKVVERNQKQFLVKEPAL